MEIRLTKGPPLKAPVLLHGFIIDQSLSLVVASRLRPHTEALAKGVLPLPLFFHFQLQPRIHAVIFIADAVCTPETLCHPIRILEPHGVDNEPFLSILPALAGLVSLLVYPIWERPNRKNQTVFVPAGVAGVVSVEVAKRSVMMASAPSPVTFVAVPKLSCAM